MPTFNQLVRKGREAVSYTHLDVYKRQDPGGSESIPDAGC